MVQREQLKTEHEQLRTKEVEMVRNQVTVQNKATSDHMHKVTYMINQLESYSSEAMYQVSETATNEQRFQGNELRPLQHQLLSQAIEFWEKMIDLDQNAPAAPGYRSPYYRAQKALCLARVGHHEEAAEQAEQAVSLDHVSGETPYIVARAYAASAAAVSTNQELRERYAVAAISQLNNSIQDGFIDGTVLRKRLTSEPDFAHLRDRDDFQHLLQELAGRSD